MHAKNRHGTICCGLIDREVFLHRYTLLMIVVDLVGLGGFLALYILLFLTRNQIDDNTWNDFFKHNPSAETKHKILDNFGYICFPLFITLVMKVYSGVRMFLKKFKKGPFSLYFMFSWTFYMSTSFQMILIIYAGKDTFSQWLWVSMIILIIMCFFSWVFVKMHMAIIDK